MKEICSTDLDFSFENFIQSKRKTSLQNSDQALEFNHDFPMDT